MKRKYVLSAAVTATIAVAGVTVSGTVAATDRFRIKNYIAAKLTPSQEVPIVSAPGAKGTFKAVINEENQTISYELSYEGLEAAPQQAHVHVGQKGVNGGVSFFLCGNPGNTPATVPPATFPQPPACPPSPATITGVITTANVVGPAGQGIAPTAPAMEFDEIVELLREGNTYANVHTTKFPGGEVRGQVRIGFLHDWRD